MPSEKILVADDSREMREFITHYVLRPNGYDTLTAEDGASALGLARLLGPDLIITDLQMPEMSGIELEKAGRGRARHPRDPDLLRRP